MNYKEIKKYTKKLLESTNVFMFNTTTINIYSFTYFFILFFSLYYLLSFIMKLDILFLIISLSLFNLAKSIKHYGFKKIPYVIMLWFLIYLLTYYIKINIMILPISFVILSYPLMIVYKKIKIRNLTHLFLYEENGLKGCNLILREVCPLDLFTNLVKINITTDKDLTGKEMKIFNDNLLYFADKEKILFMGFIYQKFKKSYEVYLYTNTQYNIEKIKKYLDDSINYNYEIETLEDKNYDYYFNKLIPSDKLFLHMCNRNIIDTKLPEGINLTEEQNLILILTFEDSNNALKCKEEIEKSKEFGKVRYEDNSKYVSDNNINTTYNHILYIEKKSRIGLSKINMITDTMYDYAKKFEGTFEEWGIGVIED